MAGRPLAAVPNIFASEGTGTLNNIPLLDQDFATLVSFNNDSAIGYNNYANDTGVANSYVITLTSPPSAYLIGMTVSFNPANTNTGASIVDVNLLGSVSILSPAFLPLQGGEISQTSIVTMIFNGICFSIIGPCALSLNVPSTVPQVFVNCAGCTSVAFNGVWTGGASIVVSLQRLAEGVPVFVSITNGTAAALNVSFSSSSNAAGSVFAQVIGLQAGTVSGGQFVDLIHTGISLSANSAMGFWGSAVSSALLVLNH